MYEDYEERENYDDEVAVELGHNDGKDTNIVA